MVRWVQESAKCQHQMVNCTQDDRASSFFFGSAQKTCDAAQHLHSETTATGCLSDIVNQLRQRERLPAICIIGSAVREARQGLSQAIGMGNLSQELPEKPSQIIYQPRLIEGQCGKIGETN